MAHIEIKRAGIVFTPVASGNLQIKNGLPIDATLQTVSDVDGNDSVLKISTEDVTNNGGGDLASNTAFGTDAFVNNISGENNTAIGRQSLILNSTGNSNSSLGSQSLNVNTTGNSNTATGREALASNANGSNNSSVGAFSLLLNNSGSNNTAIGSNGLSDLSSGSNNTAIGQNTGRGITTGSNNTILGAGVTGLSATLANNIIIADGQGNRRINVNNVGNVGIGTTTPSSKLDIVQTSVAEALRVDGSAGGFALVVNGGTSYKSAIRNASIGSSFFSTVAPSDGLIVEGNVGIGTTNFDFFEFGNFGGTPLNQKLVTGNTTDSVGVAVGSQTSSINFATLNTTSSLDTINRIVSTTTDITNNSEQGNLTFFTKSGATSTPAQVRLRIDQDGLKFNGDTAAANALDDYEEGTWTIGVTFGGASVGQTNNSNTGTYTKIGRQVTVNGFFRFTNKGVSTGNAVITGLPFIIGSGNSHYSTASLTFFNITFNTQFQGYGQVFSSTIFLEEITILGVPSTITDADFANNSSIMVSFTYFV